MHNVRIAVLAYRGCMPMQLFGMVDTLRIAADIAADIASRDAHGAHGAPVTLDVRIVALQAQEVALAGGTKVRFPRPRGKYDLVIVPGLEITRHADWDAILAKLGRETAYLKNAFARGTQIASICVGAFILGEAGLLDGRRATTSWLFAQALAARCPQARVDAGAVLLQDGGIVTTAAVSSVFDLALHLSKRFYGAATALATARTALLQETRQSQTPYVDPAMLPAGAASFSASLTDWFAQRLAAPYDLAGVALAFHVSPRTLMRRVKEETGLSPLTLLQQARAEQAKRLLLQTGWSIARITEAVGYQDQVSFDRLFRRIVGASLSGYRRQFKAAAVTSP
jgi:transcriptional regulator GlxA family with amidase domain